MDIKQEATYSPIAIVLNTPEEAEIFWDIVRAYGVKTKVPAVNMAFARQISDWFSAKAKL